MDLRDRPGALDAKALTILDAKTNLPDGTKVRLYFYSADLETLSFAEVDNGQLAIRVANNDCHEVPDGLEGSAFRVSLVVAPIFPSGCIGCQFDPGIAQPPQVQAILGPNFEHVGGDQVVELDGRRTIEVETFYQLPAETCSSKVFYTGNGTFRQVALDKPIPQPTGPFPQPPFASCPDPQGALPVEAGEFEDADGVAIAFDAALSKSDMATLGGLADPSVGSFENWSSTGSTEPSLSENAPSGNYLPAVPKGCGILVALRTVGASLAPAEGVDASVTYLLILRPDGWRVWGWLSGYGR